MSMDYLDILYRQKEHVDEEIILFANAKKRFKKNNKKRKDNQEEYVGIE